MNTAAYILLALLAGLIVIFLIVFIRALAYKKRVPEYKPSAPVFAGEEVGEHLGRLIRCETYERPGVSAAENAELARLRAELRDLYPILFEKCEPEVIGECGLMLRIPGGDKAPVIYMAHYDVVPANSAEWEFEPFCGNIVDGFVCGRGAIDTKVTLCAIFEACERLLSEGFVPSRDIYLCFGGDEETAGNGAKAIVDELEKRGVKPAMVLDEGGAVVENVFPGVKCKMAMVGVCEKGHIEMTVISRSSGGHASTPPAKTPVNVLAEAVGRVSSKPSKMTMTKPIRLFFETVGRRASFGMRLLLANLWLFSPALKLAGKIMGGEIGALMRNTVTFTMMSGSEAVNVIPSEASVGADVRLLPGTSVDSAVGRIKRLVSRLPVEVTISDAHYEPSPVSPADGEEYEKICETVGMMWQGCETVPYMLLGHSDSTVYTRICERVYRFAPVFLSSEERAMIHGVNEKIPADAAAKAADFYYYLTARL